MCCYCLFFNVAFCLFCFRYGCCLFGFSGVCCCYCCCFILFFGEVVGGLLCVFVGVFVCGGFLGFFVCFLEEFLFGVFWGGGVVGVLFICILSDNALK